MGGYLATMAKLNPYCCESFCAILVAVPLFFSPAGIPQATSIQSMRQAAAQIQPADLKADLYFLASDDLAGRNATSLEDHIATDYIAAEFMRLGLKPVGDDGTYFQKMNIITGDLDREHTTLTATVGGVDRSYTLKKISGGHTKACAPRKSAARLSFAGYGIDAPEYAYSDFSGDKSQGKNRHRLLSRASGQ